MLLTEYKFDNRIDLIDELYRRMTRDLESILELEATATLLLSGGSTPAPLYQKLASADLNWPQINVALVDERWVDAEHAASNARFLGENLLQEKAAAARFTGMKNNHPTPFSGESECNLRYADLPRPYAICLLGMGLDGHTASLFPGAQGLDEAINRQLPCAAIKAQQSEVTGEWVDRMTMTPWSILQSRKLILLITGNDKWEVFERACQNEASADHPISLFIHQNEVSLEVYWAA